MYPERHTHRRSFAGSENYPKKYRVYFVSGLTGNRLSTIRHHNKTRIGQRASCVRVNTAGDYQSEFDLAIEITESFVDHARATARVYNTNVLMRIEPDNELGQQTITLIIPKIKEILT